MLIRTVVLEGRKTSGDVFRFDRTTECARMVFARIHLRGAVGARNPRGLILFF